MTDVRITPAAIRELSRVDSLKIGRLWAPQNNPQGATHRFLLLNKSVREALKAMKQQGYSFVMTVERQKTLDDNWWYLFTFSLTSDASALAYYRLSGGPIADAISITDLTEIDTSVPAVPKVTIMDDHLKAWCAEPR